MSPAWHVLGEVAIAMALGGLIGLEREFADKPLESWLRRRRPPPRS